MSKIKNISIKEAVKTKEVGTQQIYVYQSLINKSDWVETFIPYRSSFYAVALCTDGRATFKVNLDEYEIRKGSLIFVKNDDIKQWLSRSDSYKTHTILFEKEAILSITNNQIFERDFEFFNAPNHVAQLTSESQELFEEHFLRFKNKYISQSRFKAIKLGLNLIEILYDIAELDLNPTLESRITRSKTILNQFIHLASSAVTKTRNLDYYSLKIGISKKHLSETIKAETNKTASQLLNEYLILESKVILKESISTVEEIAYQLSFSDASAFSKFFKRHTGITPRKFRS